MSAREREREEAAGGEVGAGGDNGGREGGKECEGEGTLVEGRRKGEGGRQGREGREGSGEARIREGGGASTCLSDAPSLASFPESGSGGFYFSGLGEEQTGREGRERAGKGREWAGDGEEGGDETVEGARGAP